MLHSNRSDEGVNFAAANRGSPGASERSATPKIFHLAA